MRAAQCDCGHQAFVGERRRHADVDDRHVGREFVDRFDQFVGGTNLRDHLMTPFNEQLHQAIAQDGAVFGDDEAGHCSAPGGTTTVTTVGPPAGLSISSLPSSIANRSRKPVRPEPLPTCTPPEPLSSTMIRNSAVSPLMRTEPWLAAECRVTLASSSAT